MHFHVLARVINYQCLIVRKNKQTKRKPQKNLHLLMQLHSSNYHQWYSSNLGFVYEVVSNYRTMSLRRLNNELWTHVTWVSWFNAVMDQGRQIVIGSFSWISVIKIIDRLTRWIKVDSGGINITVKIIEIQVLHEVKWTFLVWLY